MPRSRSAKFRVEPDTMRFVETFLHVQHGLTHLHLRHRADLLTIESGPPHDRVPHVRLRRTGPEQWQLEMATHTGRWQSTPMENSLDELLSMLVRDFGWVLASQA